MKKTRSKKSHDTVPLRSTGHNRTRLNFSVAVLRHFHADRLRIPFFILILIPIRLFFKKDPDPAAHRSDTNLLHCEPPQLLNFDFAVDPGSVLTLLRLGIRIFTLMRIRIRLPKMRRLHADPDSPLHQLTTSQG